jgi:hypothetical protein
MWTGLRGSPLHDGQLRAQGYTFYGQSEPKGAAVQHIFDVHLSIPDPNVFDIPSYCPPAPPYDINVDVKPSWHMIHSHDWRLGEISNRDHAERH